MGSRPRPVSSTGQALRGGMPSRERRFGCSRAFDPWTSSGGLGMGSRPRLLGGRLCAGTTVWGGVRFIFIATTIQLLSRLRPLDKVRRAGDGFPSSRERRFGWAFDPSTSWRAGSRPRLLGGRLCAGTTIQLLSQPSTLRQAQEGRGWVPVVTGTTIQLPSDLRRPLRNLSFGPKAGSRPLLNKRGSLQNRVFHPHPVSSTGQALCTSPCVTIPPPRGIGPWALGCRITGIDASAATV